MAKVKRIYQIAKELGVVSKDIVSKCKAEEVPGIDNHMSPVKIGLEMTIREWFSESDTAVPHTAVETAAKVDLTKVKAKARKKAKPKTAVANASADSTGTTAVAEPPVTAEPVVAEPAATVTQDVVPAEPVVADKATETVAEPVVEETVKETVKETAQKTTEETIAAIEEVAEEVTEDSSVATVEATDETVITDDTAAKDEIVAQDKVAKPEEGVTPEQLAGKAKARAMAKPKEDDATATKPAKKQDRKKRKPKTSARPEPGRPRQVAVPNVPTRPDVVTPAGPKLEAPKAAKLKGPKVVRIEQPDVIRAPRKRQTEQEPQGDLIRSRGPVRGRGAGGAGAGGAGAGGAGAGAGAGRPGDTTGRSPRRRRGGGSSGRRGRTASAEHTLKGKFSEQDLIEREARLNRAGGSLGRRQRAMRNRSSMAAPLLTPAQVGGKVEIEEPISIKSLSAVTGVKGADLVNFLFNKGVMATINAAIDTELAMEACLEYDIELVVKEAQTAEEQVIAQMSTREPVDVKRRPPVVAVLGHVDHGKTSLLDKIRQEDVAAHEAGGITQHIGAYRTTITGGDGNDRTVVFLDTPGHEAFTSMRSRGANLTDIVVVVVAADDGIMPQTIESINHAKAAKVPVVIALNKMDTPQATDENIQRILGQLAEQGLNPVEWGGETEVVRTSAITGDGVTDLIEILDYQAELLELTADYGGSGYGQVIEAEVSEGRGSVARILVRGGEIKVGDFIVMGRAFGRIRDMVDDKGRRIKIAGPATPVEISGIDKVPDAGDQVYLPDSLKTAEQIAEQYRDSERKKQLAQTTTVTLDNVFDQMKAGDVKELRIVVKADVQGSVEVLKKTLEEVGKDNEEVTVRVLHAAVGGIAESDVLLAEASDAIIIGFQVIASQRARKEAEQRGVDVRLYRVIYDIIDDVKAALEGMLTPEKREKVLGHAEVRDVFRVSKVGMVAGCYVTDGEVRRNASIRVTRDGIVVEHDRLLSSLKRFKDDAKDVRSGMECGMSIEGYDDIRAGDVLECYETTEVKKTL